MFKGDHCLHMVSSDDTLVYYLTFKQRLRPSIRCYRTSIIHKTTLCLHV